MNFKLNSYINFSFKWGEYSLLHCIYLQWQLIFLHYSDVPSVTVMSPLWQKSPLCDKSSPPWHFYLFKVIKRKKKWKKLFTTFEFVCLYFNKLTEVPAVIPIYFRKIIIFVGIFVTEGTIQCWTKHYISSAQSQETNLIT